MRGVVVLQGVTFAYPGARVPALSGVTLELRPGEVTWIYGPLGAGASTLLMAIAGLAPRHTGGTLEGPVSVSGHDPATEYRNPELLGRVAYVTASPRVQLSEVAATVFEEVAFAPANLGWPRERIGRSVAAAMDRLGVGHLALRAPTTLSGGEMQRVVIASMLALDPAVWLLDEPSTALDRAGRVAVGELMREAAAGGATVVVATEDADGMLEVADRLVVLSGGRVALDGSPKQILRGEELWGTGVGSTSVATLAHRAHALNGAAPGLQPPYPLDVDEALVRWTR